MKRPGADVVWIRALFSVNCAAVRFLKRTARTSRVMLLIAQAVRTWSPTVTVAVLNCRKT